MFGADDYRMCTKINIIRLILTLSHSGYFRQLTIRVGGGGVGLKPPPSKITKSIVSIFTISYMCILLGVLVMFQWEFFKNLRFWLCYSDFKIKRSKNSCIKIFLLFLFKMNPTISKSIVSIFTILYMCILLGVLGMFQMEFFKNLRF